MFKSKLFLNTFVIKFKQNLDMESLVENFNYYSSILHSFKEMKILQVESTNSVAISSNSFKYCTQNHEITGYKSIHHERANLKVIQFENEIYVQNFLSMMQGLCEPCYNFKLLSNNKKSESIEKETKNEFNMLYIGFIVLFFFNFLK